MKRALAKEKAGRRKSDTATYNDRLARLQTDFDALTKEKTEMQEVDAATQPRDETPDCPDRDPEGCRKCGKRKCKCKNPPPEDT